MAAVNVVLMAAAAEHEARRQAVLKQLRDAGATGPSSAVELKLEGEEASTALDELIESGKIIDVGGRYYAEPKPTASAKPHTGFSILLGLLIVLSICASLFTLVLL